MTRVAHAPMAIRLDESPWQQLPEMAKTRAADLAGVEAGLRLLELFHHHNARRSAGKDRPALKRHLHLAVAVAASRIAILGVFK